MVAVASSEGSPGKKAAAAKQTATRSAKPSLHPTYMVMITTSIAALKDRKGSSRQKIAKYINHNYEGLDESKVNHFLKAALRKALEKGVIVNSKGNGASGSFKLASSTKDTVSKVAAAAAPKKTKPAAKPKKSPVAKKPAAAAAAAKSPRMTVKKATPSKKKATAAKKAAKSPKKVKPVARSKVTKAKSNKAKPAAAKKPARKQGTPKKK